MNAPSVLKTGSQVVLVAAIAVVASLSPARDEPPAAPAPADVPAAPVAGLPDAVAAFFRAECPNGRTGPRAATDLKPSYVCESPDRTLTVRLLAEGPLSQAGATEALLRVTDSRRSHAEGFGYATLMRRNAAGWAPLRRVMDSVDSLDVLATLHRKDGRDLLFACDQGCWQGCCAGACFALDVNAPDRRVPAIDTFDGSDVAASTYRVRSVRGVELRDVDRDGVPDLVVRLHVESGRLVAGKDAPVRNAGVSKNLEVKLRFDGSTLKPVKPIPACRGCEC